MFITRQYTFQLNRFDLRITLTIIGALTLNALFGGLILRIRSRPKRVKMNTYNNNTPTEGKNHK